MSGGYYDAQRRYQDRHNLRSVRLREETKRALQEYQRRHGFRNLSDAIDSLLDKRAK